MNVWMYRVCDMHLYPESCRRSWGESEGRLGLSLDHHHCCCDSLTAHDTWAAPWFTGELPGSAQLTTASFKDGKVLLFQLVFSISTTTEGSGLRWNGKLTENPQALVPAAPASGHVLRDCKGLNNFLAKDNVTSLHRKATFMIKLS